MLRDIKRRGLSRRPVARGFITDRDGELLELEADHRRHAEMECHTRDGHLGIWGALRNVYPQAAEQRCWNHKIVNVLAIPRIAAPADGHRGPCAAMKTVRRPPYPKWNFQDQATPSIAHAAYYPLRADSDRG